MKTSKSHKIFMNSDTAKKCMKAGFAPRLRDDRKFLKTLIRITNILNTFPKVLNEKGVSNSLYDCLEIVGGKVEKCINGNFKLNDIEYKVFYTSVKSLIECAWENRDKWTGNQRIRIESLVSKLPNLPSPSTNPNFQDPFAEYQISDKSLHPDLLQSTKSICTICNTPKTLYCPFCYQIVNAKNFIPRVELPVLLDVVIHPNVSSKNTTSVHAKLICPDQVEMIKNFQIPEYDYESTFILFPSEKSVTVDELTEDQIKAIKRVILIESSWDGCEKILSHKSLQPLRHLKLLPMKKTLYWRDHHFGSEGVCTIEAIYYFYRQYYEKLNNNNYDGRYDNLLFYFRVGFQKALLYYKQNNLIAPLQWAQ